jgi:hypothetical protein
MKKLLFAILFMTPALDLGATAKPNPAEYTVAVHVYSSGMASICNNTFGSPGCKLRQHLNVVIDGKKYELNSKNYADAALMTGDYKAKLITGEPPDPYTDKPPTSYEYHQIYEFLFPDGKTRRYLVVGGSE